MQKNKEYPKKSMFFYTGEIPEVLKRYLDNVDWSTVLDIGAGDGAFLAYLTKTGRLNGKHAYAVDISAERIEFCKHIDESIDCYVEDACNLASISDGFVDFVVSSKVIEHVSSDIKMMKEVKRILKPGGIAYISTVFKKKYGCYYHRRNRKWVLDPTHVREYTDRRQLLDIYEELHLQVLESLISPVRYSLIDFFIRKRGKSLDISDSGLFKLFRKIKVPVPGYFQWEIVCRK